MSDPRERARAALAEYERLRERDGVIYGDEVAALADRQHWALHALLDATEPTGDEREALIGREQPVTDVEVEAAARALRCVWSMPDDDHPLGKLCRHEGACLDRARAALEAAREARA